MLCPGGAAGARARFRAAHNTTSKRIIALRRPHGSAPAIWALPPSSEGAEGAGLQTKPQDPNYGVIGHNGAAPAVTQHQAGVPNSNASLDPVNPAAVNAAAQQQQQSPAYNGGTVEEQLPPQQGLQHQGSGTAALAAPAPAGEEGGIPHRWKLVWMMSAAFVLCNMDKVRAP